MADYVDHATVLADAHLEKSIIAARAPVPVGAPGECAQCGEDMPRLVRGRCGFCRDGRVPPPSWFEAREASANG